MIDASVEKIVAVSLYRRRRVIQARNVAVRQRIKRGDPHTDRVEKGLRNLIEKGFESQLTTTSRRKFQSLILDSCPLERWQKFMRGFITNGCEKSVALAATILQGLLKTDTLRFISSATISSASSR